MIATRSSRRDFLRTAAGLSLLGAFPFPAFANSGSRELEFLHTHTGERLRLEYHDGHRYLDDALAEANHFLRDFRTGDLHSMDPRLFDYLWQVQRQTGKEKIVWQVISGYRSPRTNTMLRKRSKGVAKRSLHMQGRAIDVRIEGLDTRQLYRTALALRCGGVGCYTKSRFVHLDTGRFRTWGS